MGRGRAKAKQAKVARQLKYSGGGTDLEALRKELVGTSHDVGESYEADGDEADDSYDDDDELDIDEADDDRDDLGGAYGASGGR